MTKVVGVRFRRAGKIYYFDPGKAKMAAGSHVIVETARGIEYGTVLIAPKEVDDKAVVQPLKPVIRVATPEDDKTEQRNKEKEKEAFKKEMQDKYNKLPEAQKEAYKKASEAGLKATVNACNDYIERVEEAILRDKLGELPEAISFSYIAKKYFGKSRNWLYQRINGNIVNGKKARFTDNELKTFLNALNDVSEMIHQTSLKIS